MEGGEKNRNKEIGIAGEREEKGRREERQTLVAGRESIHADHTGTRG